VRSLAIAAMGLALVGLIVSVGLIVGGLLDLNEHLRPLGVADFVGFFAVVWPTIHLKRQYGGERPWADLYSGCPPWLRRLGYVLMGLGAVLFYWPLVSRGRGAPAAAGTNLDPSAIGSFGLIVYSACFNQLFSLLRLDDDSPAAG